MGGEGGLEGVAEGLDLAAVDLGGLRPLEQGGRREPPGAGLGHGTEGDRQLLGLGRRGGGSAGAGSAAAAAARAAAAGSAPAGATAAAVGGGVIGLSPAAPGARGGRGRPVDFVGLHVVGDSALADRLRGRMPTGFGRGASLTAIDDANDLAERRPGNPDGGADADDEAPGRVPGGRAGDDEQGDGQDREEHEPGAPGPRPACRGIPAPAPSEATRGPQRSNGAGPVGRAADLVEKPRGRDQEQGGTERDAGHRAARSLLGGAVPAVGMMVSSPQENPAQVEQSGRQEDPGPAEEVGDPVVEPPPDRTGQAAVDPEAAQPGEDDEGEAPDVVGLAPEDAREARGQAAQG